MRTDDLDSPEAVHRGGPALRTRRESGLDARPHAQDPQADDRCRRHARGSRPGWHSNSLLEHRAGPARQGRGAVRSSSEHGRRRRGAGVRTRRRRRLRPSTPLAERLTRPHFDAVRHRSLRGRDRAGAAVDSTGCGEARRSTCVRHLGGRPARHGRGHRRRCGRPADHRPAALARLHTGCRLMFVTDDDLVRDIAYTLADGSKSPSNTLFQGSN